MYDREYLLNFLRWAEIEKDGLIEYRILRFDGTQYKNHFSSYTTKVDDLDYIAGIQSPNELIVVGINPRPKEGLNKDKDITIYKNIYLDIEPIHPKDTPASPDQIDNLNIFIKHLLDMINFHHKAFLCPFTGNGYHLLFAIPNQSNPMAFYENLIGFYDHIQIQTRDLREKYGVRIDNTLSPSRQVKLYGTKKPIKGFKLSQFPSVERVEDQNFVDYIKTFNNNLTVNVSNSINVITGYADLDSDNLIKVWKLDQDSLFNQLFEGTKELTNDNSRSGKDMALSTFLAKKGLTAPSLACIIKEAPYNVDKKFSEAYLNHTVKKAMANLDNLDNKEYPPTPNGPGNAGIQKQLGNIDQVGASTLPLDTSRLFLPFSKIKDIIFPEIPKIQTGIPCIDSYTDGGLGIPEVSLWVAEKETGKSTLACYVGASAKKSGYNVVHVFYEDELSNMQQRYNNCLYIDPTENEVYLCEANKSSVIITTKIIEEAIKEHKPGLVIIDYLDKLAGAEGFETTDRGGIQKFLNRAIKLSVQYNCHIMITDHVTVVNKDFDKSYFMRDDRISEAKRAKLAIPHIVLGFMRDRFDINLLHVTGMKMKRKAKKLYAKLNVDWDKVTFKEVI